MYLYINGAPDDAALERIQQSLSAVANISPLIRDARTGCTGLYCHPGQVLEVTTRVASAGYSVAGVQFLGAQRASAAPALTRARSA